MIDPIKWNKIFAVGEPDLDADHRESLRLINQFIDCVQVGKSRAECAPVLDELLKLTRDHFKRETRLLENSALADKAKAHMAEHDHLLVDLEKISRDFREDTDTPAPAALAEHLKVWYINHAVKFDSKLKAFLG